VTARKQRHQLPGTKQDFVEGVTFRTRRTVVAQQVNVEVYRSFPFVGIERRLHVFIEPGATEGIDDSGDEGHVVTPAWLAAQTSAVNAVVRIVDGSGCGFDVVPGIVICDRYTRSVSEILAVHHHG